LDGAETVEILDCIHLRDHLENLILIREHCQVKVRAQDVLAVHWELLSTLSCDDELGALSL